MVVDSGQSRLHDRNKATNIEQMQSSLPDDQFTEQQRYSLHTRREWDLGGAWPFIRARAKSYVPMI